MRKTVAVIIPTFNRPNTLKKVIDSYINQKYINELIIIDDGSYKKYDEVNNYIRSKLKDKEINYIYKKNNKNMGAGFCRNEGLRIAKSNFILWGEDDLFLGHDYISVLLSKIDKKTAICGSIYYGLDVDMNFTDEKKIISQQKIKKNRVFNYKLFEGYYRLDTKKDIRIPFGHAIIMAPKTIYEKIEYYEGYMVNGYREESDAQIQMLKRGIKIIYTSDTSCYHLSGDVIEKGGQHTSSFFKQEIFKIINNYIFLKRHHQFLNDEFSLNRSFMKSNWLYLKYIIKKNIKGILKRFVIKNG
ncbi:GT2 family glycosyltransferase [Halanaerobium saccharolyticum]|uniref:GT2 family glycosyltransferase n=1 Tax=Halanaerobium saccharolyticum TaxID=43595 RepID=A0A4R6R8F3_9FIRM|nr:glycosyltransferase [Halanaerobium saccharolyticum]TDP82301.1 GT2 family glycosyltransferase [Halanaerobium saccharolyticum]